MHEGKKSPNIGYTRVMIVVVLLSMVSYALLKVTSSHIE